MGEFLDAFAIRAPAEPVASALARYASAHGVEATVEPGDSPDVDVCDVVLYPSPGGWTVALWPPGAGRPAAAARELSRELGTVASVVSVFDGDLWTHVLFEAGEERDRFASDPEYFAGDRTARWHSDPAVVAATLGAAAHPIPDSDVDPCDFVDFWRSAGIVYPSTPVYPEPPPVPSCGVDLAAGWEDRLPSGTEWTL
jgi:hypothetical protein